MNSLQPFTRKTIPDRDIERLYVVLGLQTEIIDCWDTVSDAIRDLRATFERFRITSRIEHVGRMPYAEVLRLYISFSVALDMDGYFNLDKLDNAVLQRQKMLDGVCIQFVKDCPVLILFIQQTLKLLVSNHPRKNDFKVLLTRN